MLKSCAKFPSLKRVVLTSSIAAVAYNKKPQTLDVVVDETWFTDHDLCRESNVCAFHFFNANLVQQIFTDYCFYLICTTQLLLDYNHTCQWLLNVDHIKQRFVQISTICSNTAMV